MRQRRWNPDFSRLLLPLVIAVVVVALLMKWAFGGSDEWATIAHTGDFVTVSVSSGSSADIFYQKDSSKAITGVQKLYPSDDRVSVKSGEINVKTSASSDITLIARSELSYSGRSTGETFDLRNGAIWIDAQESLTVGTSHARMNIASGSVVSMYRSVLASKVYVLRGSVTVASGKNSASVGVGQQLEITAADSTSPTGIASKISPIGSEFRTSELFVRKGGDAYLVSSTTPPLGGSGTSASGTVSDTMTTLLVISPLDESTAEGETIDITGRVSSLVKKVMVGDRTALLDTALSTFQLKGYALKSGANDIVIKALDEGGLILSKKALTIYGSTALKSTPSVTTYPISSKDFPILSPATNPFRTTDRSVRIEGRAPKGTVKYITVNDYRLQKFPALGSYWLYFANMDQGNLAVGLNEYLIRYFDVNDNEVFKQKIVIVRDDPVPVSSEVGTR